MTTPTEALRARLAAESAMQAGRGDRHLSRLLDEVALALAQRDSMTTDTESLPEPSIHIAFDSSYTAIRFWTASAGHAAEWSHDNGLTTTAFYTADQMRAALAQQARVPDASIAAALASQACTRLREWAAVGPVQRAAVESFADALQQASAPSAEPPAFDAEGFRAFVLRELPDDTVIGKGAWWADHFTKCAQWFITPLYAVPLMANGLTSPRDDYEAGDSFAGLGETAATASVAPRLAGLYAIAEAIATPPAASAPTVHPRRPLTDSQVQHLIDTKHFDPHYSLKASDRVCIDWYRLGLRDGEVAHGIGAPTAPTGSAG